MTRVKEGLEALLADLAQQEVMDVDMETLDGYFGERPLTEKQTDAVLSALNDAGYSVQPIYRIYRDVEGYRAFFAPEQQPVEAAQGMLRALSIRQPHVERILRGDKNVEYRTWAVREMGPLLLHASNTRESPDLFAEAGIEDPDTLPYGALVGVVDVVACLYDEANDGYEWLLAHPRRFTRSIPFKGAASIFKVPFVEVQDQL